MNDTPTQTIADALLLLSLGERNEIGKDASERLMKLERENAALRADLLIEEERSIYWRDNENKAMAENAALRSALTTLLAWEDKGGDIPPTAARGLFRIARAALDSARKEAQPCQS